VTEADVQTPLEVYQELLGAPGGFAVRGCTFVGQLALRTRELV
jgi:hypothetical protein